MSIKPVALSHLVRSVIGLASLHILGLLGSSLPLASGQEPEQVSINFARDVRPLLSDRCFACHGPDSENRQAELRVDQFESLVEVRGDGQVVKHGDAANRELIRRVTSDDPDLRMPPTDEGKPLTGN